MVLDFVFEQIQQGPDRSHGPFGQGAEGPAADIPGLVVKHRQVVFSALALLEAVIDLAPRLNNLSRLAAEFRRTQRKVNALEHVIVPELTQSIHEIEFVLEEMERENMVRALHVKKTSARRR